MGNVLAFKSKEVVRTKLETDGPQEANCDECSAVLPIEQLYLDNDGKLICGHCITVVTKNKEA